MGVRYVVCFTFCLLYLPLSHFLTLGRTGIVFCFRHVTRVHKRNTSDVRVLGPNSGIGRILDFDVYRSSEFHLIPSMCCLTSV